MHSLLKVVVFLSLCFQSLSYLYFKESDECILYPTQECYPNSSGGEHCSSVHTWICQQNCTNPKEEPQMCNGPNSSIFTADFAHDIEFPQIHEFISDIFVSDKFIAIYKEDGIVQPSYQTNFSCDHFYFKTVYSGTSNYYLFPNRCLLTWNTKF